MLFSRSRVALAALMFSVAETHVPSLPTAFPTVPPSVPREFRAAYVTPIWDRGFRDWPSRPGLAPDSQRAELRAMLDHAVAVGLNAVILHVRIAGDAMYPTPLAPWSAFLSARSGEPPEPMYDPLAFAVAEAHARGLQLHAWFNPFRAMLPIFAGKAAPSHVTRKHPEWIRKYGTQTWIDPGDPAARKYVLETMLDVVRRYDIDGVHIDDYFYPYRESRVVTRRVRKRRVRTRVEIQFPDDRTWSRYGKGKGFQSRDAWRRDNINDFVQSLYQGVKAIKPGVIVGISPFGIWRSGVPDGVYGLDAFGEIYADSRKWLTEGWLDYIAPQLYWQVAGDQDRFRALDAWWQQVNVKNRYVWPALYTSKVFGAYDAWSIGEIHNQVAALRGSRVDTTEMPGHVHFRMNALFADGGRLAQSLAEDYRERAIVPAFPWLGSDAPAAPLVSSVAAGDGPAKFSIAPGDSVRVRWWVIQTRGSDGQWTTTVRHAGDGQVGAMAYGTSAPDELAVTAIGVSGVASTATVVVP
ncbi:MAG TPA: family 10 glycosylhydrolase [Gemmatimonadaceae bacterium]